MTGPQAPLVRVVQPADGSLYFALRLALLRSDPLAYVTTAEEWAGGPSRTWPGDCNRPART